MKICLVTNIYAPYQLGGTEVYVKWLAQTIERSGQEVFVITTCPARRSFPGLIKESIAGITVYRFYPWNIYWGYKAQNKPLFLKPFWHLVELWNPQVYLYVKRILKEEAPDIVHINNMGGFSNAIFWACKDNGRRVIYTLHDHISVCPKSILLKSNLQRCSQPRLPCKIYQIIKKWCIEGRLDYCISPSSFTLDIHREHGLLNKGQSCVLPQGIEIACQDTDSEEGSKGTGEGDNCINLLYLGQVVRHKGLSVLAGAFRKSERKDLRLHIAGSGEYLTQMRQDLQHFNNVTFYGYVSGPEKEELFGKCDACVLPSICYDNSPLVTLEAYKHGLPVIGSRVGGIPEMIREGRTGYLFEPGDESALCSVFKHISKKRLRAMADDCQMTALDYSLEKHQEKLMAIYSSLLGG